MKKYKGLLVFVLMFASFLFLGSTKCFAEDIQYTDNVIPIMTSDTSPSGKASASSIWDSQYSAYHAFDHIGSTFYNSWATERGVTKGWIEYEFQDYKCITKYALISRDNSIVGELPKNWTFEAYDENLQNWITLDTQNSISDWKIGIKKEFTFKNINLYKRYRINISSNNGYSTQTAFGEMEMMETVTGSAISGPKLVLEKNETKQLSVSEELSDNTNLTWVSSNPAVATVDANGRVKAMKPGDTVITCTSTDGEYTDKINVLVVNLNYQLAVDLTIGDNCRLTVDDLKNTTKVTWAVNDPSIATVSNKGRVTAVSEGLTFVTATDETGKIIGQIYIRVRQ